MHRSTRTLPYLTLLLAVILIVLPSSGFADPGDTVWDQSVGGPDSDAFADLVELTSGDLLAAGWTGEHPDHLAVFRAARFTPDGTLLWDLSYPGPTEETLFAAAPTPDDGALLVGTSNVFTGGGSDVILKRIDGNGALIDSASWSMGAAVAEVATAVVPTMTAGQFVITGYLLESGQADLPFFLRVNDDLEEVTSTSWAAGSGGRGFDIVPLNVSDYMLCGYQTPGTVKQATIWLMGEDGELWDQMSLPGLDFDTEAWALAQDHFRGFWVAGHADPEGTGSLRGLLFHAFGGNNWYQLYGDNSTHFDDIKRVDDELIITGNHMLAGFDFAGYTLGVAADESGEVLWEHEYNPAQGYANGTAVLPLFPGEVAVTGQAVDGNYQAFIERIEASPEEVYFEAFPTTFPVIPADGGDIEWSLLLSNPFPGPYPVLMRVGVTTPADVVVPVAQQAVTLPPQHQIHLPDLTQAVPAWAPGGIYRFHIVMTQQGNTVGYDKFDFNKEFLAGAPERAGSWPSDGLAPLAATLSADPVDEEPAVSATPAQPQEFRLHPVYPNPFNHQMTVTVDLPRASDLTVAVYDILGRQVSQLHTGHANAGVIKLTFDGRNLSSGTYFVRAKAPGIGSAVEKATLQK